MRTNESQQNIVVLSDIREERSRALSPYGPVKAGLTTWPDHSTPTESLDHQLSELLSSLEKKIDDLNFKSFEAYDTLMLAIEGVRVALYDTVIERAGTDE